MAFLPNVPARQPEPASLRLALSRRLRKLERMFGIPELQRESLSADQVVEYYERCHDAYRKYHSKEGAVHMALNDGDRFDPDGFYGQLRLMELGWFAPEQSPPADVLELAFGQGFNLAYLADRHPQTRFAGIDITPAHLQLAQERLQRAGLANAKPELGDFHDLPYADASFDHAFCIEAMCYATDLDRTLSEAARVLRPGGSLTLFDGYLLRPPQQMQPDEALAVDLVARGMAMERLQQLSEVLATAQRVGLQTVNVAALDHSVLPSLRRLERVTGAVIRFPWLGRRLLARRSPARSRNILAGYLMGNTVELGLIGYRHIVLRKEQ